MDNPVASITKSYSRKINLQAYGGKQYENADFFESRNYSWFTEPTVEEMNIKGEQLFSQCFNAIEKQIEKYITIMPKK